MRRLVGVVVLIVSATIVGMAVANRHAVTLYFDPLRSPDRAVELPLFAALLAALTFGVLLGGVVTRLSMRRRDGRARKRAASPLAPATATPAHAPVGQALLTHRRGERLPT